MPVAVEQAFYNADRLVTASNRLRRNRDLCFSLTAKERTERVWKAEKRRVQSAIAIADSYKNANAGIAKEESEAKEREYFRSRAPAVVGHCLAVYCPLSKAKVYPLSVCLFKILTLVTAPLYIMYFDLKWAEPADFIRDKESRFVGTGPRFVEQTADKSEKGEVGVYMDLGRLCFCNWIVKQGWKFLVIKSWF